MYVNLELIIINDNVDTIFTLTISSGIRWIKKYSVILASA